VYLARAAANDAEPATAEVGEAEAVVVDDDAVPELLPHAAARPTTAIRPTMAAK